MMSFNVVTIYDNRRWDRFVRNAHMSDFHHTWHYHSTAADGEPLLLVYEEETEFIALPVIRKNEGESNGVRQYSLHSYAGPLCSTNFALLNSGMQERFESVLRVFIEQHTIISVTVRLHPLIHKNFKPINLGVLRKHAESLLLQVGDAVEMRREHFGEGFSNHVSQLKRKGYTVRQAVAIQDVDDFGAIFRRNMAALNPGSADHYDKAWFRQMLRPGGFDTSLLLAGQGAQTTGGALLTFCNDLMQLHLAATHENFLFDGPLRLLLHEALLLGRSLGMQHLLLEGLGGKPEVLFACKAYSPDLYPGFTTWQIAVSEAGSRDARACKLRQPLSVAV
ncbi:hypothetical protein [Chitinophaga rhizophila]|uniref:Acetyltransferase (GNAT) family protein n=1 Tax=Chitinophaga rhizophila TaxID=2866212 RepID=A0ABS7GI18_9BACT|nr:hypothetical protein [Chitinophaga rhizophila]MBW8687339.1 hypothetical protein [Chitinophaga rhizophila]